MKLEAKSLAALPGICHAFFTREGGVSQGLYATLNGGIGSHDKPEAVDENRARMATAVGVRPENFLSLYQVHSPDVVTVEKPWTRNDRPRADAAVTAVPGLALGISTADCGPVLFAEPKARVIGAAHAGWKGALGGVLEATIGAMEKLGAQRERISVALGPMIRQRSYEVGPEFVERFIADNPNNSRYFEMSGREDRRQFDLSGYVSARLARAGVTQIEDLGFDTCADPARFYSYRRSTLNKEPDYGRHINAIALAD
ncbi:MAG: peptidoglycan editing factor PgeF [Pseudolabrys sp.]|nr:peptidoglycan editing factor PgeF [Pseudolabrys sp.]